MTETETTSLSSGSSIHACLLSDVLGYIKYFKKVTVLLVAMMMLAFSAHGSPQQEQAEAYEIYLAASACVAAYSDRPGNLAIQYLRQQGWEIQHYQETSAAADARFVLLKNVKADEQEPQYLLAFTGTENWKDLKTNLRTGKVLFAGKTMTEFAVSAARKDVPRSEPMVHRGFHEYVQTALTVRTAQGDGEEGLADRLLADPSRKVYLTGHSLGGAAATVGAARLISMGVQPEQLVVITFGAPAVGNQAFRDQFEPLLNLRRMVISGDIVTKMLQKLAGKYVQFGREIRWVSPDWANKDPHVMTEYLDFAIKNYYDKRQEPQKPPLVAEAGTEKFYVAAVQFALPDRLAGEQRYIQYILDDEYSRTLPGWTAGIGETGQAAREAAVASSSKWLLVSEVTGYRLRQEQERYYMGLTETVYDMATGNVVRIAHFSANNNSLTPLEALAHAAISMSNDRQAWLEERNYKERSDL